MLLEGSITFCSNFAYLNQYSQVEQRKDLGSKFSTYFLKDASKLHADISVCCVDVDYSKMTGRNTKSAEQLNY